MFEIEVKVTIGGMEDIMRFSSKKSYESAVNRMKRFIANSSDANYDEHIKYI